MGGAMKSILAVITKLFGKMITPFNIQKIANLWKLGKPPQFKDKYFISP